MTKEERWARGRLEYYRSLGQVGQELVEFFESLLQYLTLKVEFDE